MKHINNILDREDYNQAMKQLYNVVASMLEDYTGVKDTDEYCSQEIINACEVMIIDGLKMWKEKQSTKETQ
jgi:hypothetical protein